MTLNQALPRTAPGATGRLPVSRFLIKTPRLLFVAATIVLVPVELWCADSSLETQGEVMQALLTFLIALNVICAGLFWWFPRAALAGLLLLFALIVPYQVTLLNRLTRINNEVGRFVHERLQLRATGAPLPATIDDYKFKDPSLRRYFYSYILSEDARDFSIYYFVIDSGITHWYSSKDGWGYYPD